MDPIAARTLRNWLLELADERAISFLITSHDLDDIWELSDQVVMLAEGEVRAVFQKKAGAADWPDQMQRIEQMLHEERERRPHIVMENN